MQLSIQHKTTYSFEEPVQFALQRLQLAPMKSVHQIVENWDISFTGAQKQLGYVNGFGNHNTLILVDKDVFELVIKVTGLVNTADNQGIIGFEQSYTPMWLYLQETSATQTGKSLKAIANRYKSDEASISQFHDLMAELADRVPYVIGSTNVDTTAEQALVSGAGVCQDHSHIMISIARDLGYPARYVSGYLLMDGVAEQSATHAWCEIFIKNLGWVGFDVSNRICPDERYVRIAVGRDYFDAAPITGIRHGSGNETLDVHLQIQQ